ncbi:MAG: ABC transporter ATP-binding protein [Bradyrhizobium sp.]|nr:ABC transporter ATP-binding protein [Bradyrhizobium sp.]
MPVLELRDVELRFGGLVVLNEVSFGVSAGELLALIGPNGAGKTCVFNCISGIYRANGSILFDGEELVGLRPYEVARRGIARTFQHAELFDRLTVRNNLLAARHGLMTAGVVAQMLRTPKLRREEQEHLEAVDRVLEFVGLARHRDTLVGSMPFGLQKLVGFARAIAAEPKCLLMDEPSAGLTLEEREDLAHFIVSIKQRLGIPMIWIEHDMQMVGAIANRVHVLDYGRSIGDGAPKTVLRDEEVIRAYLGTTRVTWAS